MKINIQEIRNSSGEIPVRFIESPIQTTQYDIDLRINRFQRHSLLNNIDSIQKNQRKMVYQRLTLLLIIFLFLKKFNVQVNKLKIFFKKIFLIQHRKFYHYNICMLIMRLLYKICLVCIEFSYIFLKNKIEDLQVYLIDEKIIILLPSNDIDLTRPIHDVTIQSIQEKIGITSYRQARKVHLFLQNL